MVWLQNLCPSDPDKPMKNQKQQPKQEVGSSARAPYCKPAVTEFGSVGALTQAGTTGSMEGSSGMDPFMT